MFYMFVFISAMVKVPGGYIHIKRSGGLRPGLKFGSSICGKLRPNKRQNLGKSVNIRGENWDRIVAYLH